MLAFSSSISVVVTNLRSSVLSNVLSELLMTSINLLNLASSYSKTEFIDSSYLNGYFYSISFFLNGSFDLFQNVLGHFTTHLFTITTRFLLKLCASLIIFEKIFAASNIAWEMLAFSWRPIRFGDSSSRLGPYFVTSMIFQIGDIFNKSKVYTQMLLLLTQETIRWMPSIKL